MLGPSADQRSRPARDNGPGHHTQLATRPPSIGVKFLVDGDELFDDRAVGDSIDQKAGDPIEVQQLATDLQILDFTSVAAAAVVRLRRPSPVRRCSPVVGSLDGIRRHSHRLESGFG